MTKKEYSKGIVDLIKDTAQPVEYYRGMDQVRPISLQADLSYSEDKSWYNSHLYSRSGWKCRIDNVFHQLHVRDAPPPQLSAIGRF